MKSSNFHNFLCDKVDSRLTEFVRKSLRQRNIEGKRILTITDANVVTGIANEGFFDYIFSSAALNDYIRINENLTKIHRLLRPGGTYVGNVETNDQYNMRIISRYNVIIAGILLFFSFLFRRVAPKLFGIRYLINKFGVIKHRLLSKCEALGRLRCCGFKIVKLAEIDNRLYYVTRKSVIPTNGEPCDGLFIKIAKVGIKGRAIYCYKLRTMYAYASYLHDYILNNLMIDNNGKVVEDFRVPAWGKLFRKLWLDEMPQLYNILKGELSFIGLRHLSKEFLELYPEDWREERMKVRPGFVPPYYADCPKTFEEIIESEKRYYALKKKHPVTTDVYYFIRVVINFLTLRARTG